MMNLIVENACNLPNWTSCENPCQLTIPVVSRLLSIVTYNSQWYRRRSQKVPYRRGWPADTTSLLGQLLWKLNTISGRSDDAIFAISQMMQIDILAKEMTNKYNIMWSPSFLCRRTVPRKKRSINRWQQQYDRSQNDRWTLKLDPLSRNGWRKSMGK